MSEVTHKCTHHDQSALSMFHWLHAPVTQRHVLPRQEACCVKCQRAVSLQSTCGNRDPVRTAFTHVVPTPALKAGGACAETKRTMKAPRLRPTSSPLSPSSPPWWIRTRQRWQRSSASTHSRYLRQEGVHSACMRTSYTKRPWNVKLGLKVMLYTSEIGLKEACVMFSPTSDCTVTIMITPKLTVCILRVEITIMGWVFFLKMHRATVLGRGLLSGPEQLKLGLGMKNDCEVSYRSVLPIMGRYRKTFLFVYSI